MQSKIYKIAVLSFVLVLYGCGESTDQQEASQKETEQNADDRIFVTRVQFERSEMSLGSIEEKSFPVTVKTNGMIDVPPENRAVVNATMGGYIKTTPLLIGDKVKKGQALVTIENPEFVSLQQDYMEVNEQLKYLEAEFDRHNTMIAENITSKKNFLQAESAYKTAKARHIGLRKKLQMLHISPSRVEAGTISSIVTIYAPISGSITRVNVSKGTYVSPAASILEIIDNDHIHIELSVFEKDVMKLKKDQLIYFLIPESSDKTYEATVHLIGTSIEDNRTIKVHGHLKDESAANFLTGMFVEAEIVVESAFAKALPQTAIVAQEEDHLVLQLDEQNEDGYYFKKIAVNVGNTYENFTALMSTEGLKDTDRFLTKGAFNLIEDE